MDLPSPEPFSPLELLLSAAGGIAASFGWKKIRAESIELHRRMYYNRFLPRGRIAGSRPSLVEMLSPRLEWIFLLPSPEPFSLLELLLSAAGGIAASFGWKKSVRSP